MDSTSAVSPTVYNTHTRSHNVYAQILKHTHDAKVSTTTNIFILWRIRLYIYEKTIIIIAQCTKLMLNGYICCSIIVSRYNMKSLRWMEERKCRPTSNKLSLLRQLITCKIPRWKFAWLTKLNNSLNN